MNFPWNRVANSPYRKEVLKFYRDCLNVVLRLENEHKKTYYDYIKLKFAENRKTTDIKRVQQLLSEGQEELEWIKKLLLIRDSKLINSS